MAVNVRLQMSRSGSLVDVDRRRRHFRSVDEALGRVREWRRLGTESAGQSY